MRHLLLFAALATPALSGSGCVPVAAWGQLRPDDANTRMAELIGVSGAPEGSQGDQGWFTGQPPHLTPKRVHGGVQ